MNGFIWRKNKVSFLTISRQWSLSYTNQYSKSIDWFLYDKDSVMNELRYLDFLFLVNIQISTSLTALQILLHIRSSGAVVQEGFFKKRCS